MHTFYVSFSALYFFSVHCGVPYVGGPIVSKPAQWSPVYDTTLMLVDYVFPGSGIIKAWELYAKEPGKVSLCAYRQLPVSEYQKTGCNDARITDGYNRIEISKESRIPVNQQHVIALSYKSSQNLVVRMEKDMYASQFHTSYIGYPMLNQDYLSGTWPSGYKHVYAVRAVLEDGNKLI